MTNQWALLIRTGLLLTVAAGLTVVAPPAWAGPTYDDQNEFAEEVHDHGIALGYQDIVIGSELQAICTMAIEFPKVGMNERAIVSTYMNAYGFSKADAKWFVEAGLDYCD